VECLRSARTLSPIIPAVLIRGLPAAQAEARALHTTLLQKPFEVNDLLNCAHKAIQESRAGTNPTHERTATHQRGVHA
jgi:hypothetical protein